MDTITQTENYNKGFPMMDFIYNNNIPHILFNLKIHRDQQGKIKKVVRELPTGWKNMEYQELNDKYNNYRKDKATYYNAVALNIYKSNFVVVDLDGENHKEKAQKYGKLWYSKSTSKKLPHIYFKKDAKDNNTNCIKHESGVDLVYHIVFEWRDSKLKNTSDPIRIFKDYKPLYKTTNIKPTAIEDTKPNNSFLDIVKSKSKKSTSFLLSQEEEDIISNIDIKFLDNYDTWLKIIWGLYNSFESLDLCDTVSKKSKKYTNKEDIKKYLMQDKNKLLSFGTVAHFSKLSNPKKYYEIRTKYKFSFDGDDYVLAELYLDIMGDNIIYDNNGGIYIYKNPYWEQLDKKHNYLKKSVNEVLRLAVNVKIDLANNTLKNLTMGNINQAKENELKQLINLRKKINNLSKIKNVAECVIIQLEQKEYNIDNVSPNIFCFKNVAFNMISRKKYTVNKYDYISYNTGYDYVEPTQEQINTVKTILQEIQPDPEIFKSLLSVLRCGCIGKQNPYFVLFNGGGCNGKGLILEHYKEVLGKYFTYSNKDFLLTPIKQGANTTLANLHARRMVVFSEPEDNEKINAGTLKQITDQPIMTGRGLYEDERNIQLHNITILECNKRPAIKGRHDNSLLRRIIDIHFPTTFTDDKSLLTLDNHKLINREYKNLDFINNHKTAFFQIVLNLDVDEVYIPATVKTRGQNYLMGSDELLSWINENYNLTPCKKDIVLIKDLYQHFKESEFFHNLTSTEKRTTWNKINFVENISNNMVLRKYFKKKK
jgi:hypothetical protein